MTNIIATTKAASPDGTMSAELYRELQRMGRATSAAEAAAAANASSLTTFKGTGDWGAVLYKGDTDWAWLPPGTAGQVLKTNGADADPEWVDASSYTLGTPSTTTGGTSINFTSIPTTVKRLRLSLVGLSTNGTSRLMVQPGTGGSPTTSGYVGYVCRHASGGNVYQAHLNGNFLAESVVAAQNYTGFVEFVLVNSSTNLWTMASTITANGTSNEMHTSVGNITLSGALDNVRLTTEGGTNTIDVNGGVNILYF